MSYYTEQNIFPAVDRSEWRLWDGSQMKDQNFNTMPFDFGIGTGAGFIAGYDTGGLKITATNPPSSGLHYNTGVFYCRSSEVGNKIGAYRNYISETGLYNLHPFDAGNTGWSFVYATADGKIGEYIAANSGDTWTFPTNKVLLAKIARDNTAGTGNAFPQAKISDQRRFVPQCNLYESKSDTGSTLNFKGNFEWTGNATGIVTKSTGIFTLYIGGNAFQPIRKTVGIERGISATLGNNIQLEDTGGTFVIDLMHYFPVRSSGETVTINSIHVWTSESGSSWEICELASTNWYGSPSGTLTQNINTGDAGGFVGIKTGQSLTIDGTKSYMMEVTLVTNDKRVGMAKLTYTKSWS